MTARRMTFADGQVAATATAILTAASDLPAPDIGAHVNATFTNVGGQSETLVVTLQRNGGTARRVARAVLAADEHLVIRGLPLVNGDILLATTTHATSVDYVVSDSKTGGLEIFGLDATGARKQGSSIGSATLSGDLNLAGSSGVTFEAWDASDVSVLWSNSPSLLEPDFHQRATIFFDDFMYPASATASDVTAYTSVDDSGTGTNAFQDAANGVYNVVTAAADNDYHAMRTQHQPYLFASGKKLWFEARFKLAEANTNESTWWFGLTDTVTTGGMQANTGGPLASYDGALIWKTPETAMTVNFETSNAGTQNTLSAFATAVTDTWSIAGFYFDGTATTSTITPYFYDGTSWTVGTAQNITLSGLEEMHLIFGVKAGPTAGAETLQVDYVKCVQLR